MARTAKGEQPDATKELLQLKHGSWVEEELTRGRHPEQLADELSNPDASTRVVEKEKRDRDGRVIGFDEVTIGPMKVTAAQLEEWFPNAAAAGAPPEGWGALEKDTKPDPKGA